jgi:hypothetical protein
MIRSIPAVPKEEWENAKVVPDLLGGQMTKAMCVQQRHVGEMRANRWRAKAVRGS